MQRPRKTVDPGLASPEERRPRATARASATASDSDTGAISVAGAYFVAMVEHLTLTAVFTPDEDGWTMAQLAEWPAVVTCGRTVEEARKLLLDAAREMVASYRDEGRQPPIGRGHVEPMTIDLAAA